MGTIRPEDAANYLISLYNRTAYQRDKAKLQKDVIYADLTYYAVKKERMLAEDVVTATARGLSIDRLSYGIYDYVVNTQNKCGVIDSDEISDESLVLFDPGYPTYKYDEGTLTEEQESFLYFIFLNLGAYSGEDLTVMSKETKLWKEARIGKDETQNPSITSDMYDDFLVAMNINNGMSDDKKKENIVQYLKKLLTEKREKDNQKYDEIIKGQLGSILG